MRVSDGVSNLFERSAGCEHGEGARKWNHACCSKAGGNAHHVAFRNTTVDMAFRKYLLENSRLCRGCQIGIQIGRAVVVDHVEELDGMSAAEIAAAAEAAAERGLSGKYLLQISNTTRVPILTSLKNRSLRQRVWEASAYRGLGRDGGIDQRRLVPHR